MNSQLPPCLEQPGAVTSSSLSRASLSFLCLSRASSQTCCQRAESWFILGFFVSDWEIMGMLGGAACPKHFPAKKKGEELLEVLFMESEEQQ